MKVEIVLRSGKAFTGYLEQTEQEQLQRYLTEGRVASPFLTLRELPIYQGFDRVIIDIGEIAAILYPYIGDGK